MNSAGKWILCFLFLSFLTSYTQQPENQIAVLNLDPIGATVAESNTLTERLRSELVNTGYFTVIERKEMDEILTEQGFQQSGCTSDACAVEIGRLLNIRRICAGSIGKVGNIYTITLRMIDVETGVILFTVTEDCPCRIEEVLTRSMKNLAVKLADMSRSKLGMAMLKGSGDIYLKTEPTGAEVFIDGKKLSELTPLTIRKVESGEHVIKVVKGDYIGTQVVTVIPNEIAQTTILLSRARGGLKVYSYPAEADIYIENKYQGQTPKVIQEISAGEYLVSVRKAGYLDMTKRVKVSPETFAEVEFTMIKPASLSITSQPTNTEVTLVNSQGQENAKTPLYKENLLPERIYVEVSAPGYETERRYITLREAFKNEEFFNLKKLPTILIRSDPLGARVYVNDEYKGVTPLTIHGMKNTRVRIHLKKVYYDDWEGEMTFSSTGDLEISPELIARKAPIMITSQPEGAQIFLKLENKTTIGTTPYQGTLPCGEYEITLQHPQCQSVTEKVVLDEKGVEQSFKLPYKTGRLKIVGQPKGSTILLNGRVIDFPEEGRDLPIANYEVIVKRSGYHRKKASIQIQADKILTLNGSLKPKTNSGAVMRSLFLPGLGQWYQEKKARTFLYPAFFIGAAAGSYYFRVVQYNESVDNYHAIRTAYQSSFSESQITALRAQMYDAYDDIQSAKDLGIYLIMATGGVWLLNVLDALILPPRYERAWAISLDEEKDRLCLNLKISW